MRTTLLSTSPGSTSTSSPAGTTNVCQPSGRKSQALYDEGPGMPGVSGDAKAYADPTPPLRANDPGVVPWRSVEGLSPSGGSFHGRSVDDAAAGEAGLPCMANSISAQE